MSPVLGMGPSVGPAEMMGMVELEDGGMKVGYGLSVGYAVGSEIGTVGFTVGCGIGAIGIVGCGAGTVGYAVGSG